MVMQALADYISSNTTCPGIFEQVRARQRCAVALAAPSGLPPHVAALSAMAWPTSR
jgi:hypothetical protein